MLALTGCLTTSATVTASNPHPDLPANYRRMVADYMKTQVVAQIGGEWLRRQAFEISDPHRHFSGYDVVCVRMGDGTVRGYAFSGGQLQTLTGYPVSGVLTMTAMCGDVPVFRPFPEWNRP
jgi:hypothetical protein